MENQAIELKKEFENRPAILGSAFMPQTFSEKLKLAEVLAASGLCPSGMNTAQKVFVALQMGHELNLAPMIAINNIAIVNGRPTVMTDVKKGIAFQTGKVKDYKVIEEKDDKGNVIAVKATATRTDLNISLEGSFSMIQAEKAGLLNKDNWKKYPEIMMTHRANSRLFNSLFPELLAGLLTPEEAEDLPKIIDVTPNNHLANAKARLEAEKKEIETTKQEVIIESELEKESNEILKSLKEGKEYLQGEARILTIKNSEALKDISIIDPGDTYAVIQKKQAQEVEKIEPDTKLLIEPENEQEAPKIFESDIYEKHPELKHDPFTATFPEPKKEKQPAFDSKEVLSALLARAKPFKATMKTADKNRFSTISIGIRSGQFDWQGYTINQYHADLAIVESYEKKEKK